MTDVPVQNAPVTNAPVANSPVTTITGPTITGPTITVRYFAAAAEAAGREQEQLAFDAAPTVGDLHDRLIATYGDPMARVLRSGSFLVDGVVSRDHARPAGSSIDVLPQFAGG